LRNRAVGYGGKKPIQARWSHPTDPRLKRERSFATKREARAWIAQQDTDAARGGWVDPNRGHATVQAVAEEWLASRVRIGPRTMAGYQNILKVHIYPEWGKRRIASVDAAELQRWVNKLAKRRAPTTVHQILGVLNQVMRFAVRRGRIVVNPCTTVERPSKYRRVVIRPLTHSEVRALADSMPSHQDRCAVLIAAYMGLRAGELWALQRFDLNPLRRELTVARALKEVSANLGLPEGHTRITPSLIMGPTKTKATRKLSIPAFLIDELAGLKPTGDFLFVGPDGGPMRHTNWTSRVWANYRPAGARFHDLRHTCASLLIEQGRHPVEIAKHLGHTDVTVTLNIYSHMFPSTGEAMAEAMDAAWRQTG
jgi:integrase